MNWNIKRYNTFASHTILWTYPWSIHILDLLHTSGIWTGRGLCFMDCCEVPRGPSRRLTSCSWLDSPDQYGSKQYDHAPFCSGVEPASSNLPIWSLRSPSYTPFSRMRIETISLCPAFCLWIAIAKLFLGVSADFALGRLKGTLTETSSNSVFGTALQSHTNGFMWYSVCTRGESTMAAAANVEFLESTDAMKMLDKELWVVKLVVEWDGSKIKIVRQRKGTNAYKGSLSLHNISTRRTYIIVPYWRKTL